MARSRLSLLSRGFTAGALALASLVTAESCGFPDHTFVDDTLFYGRPDGGVLSKGGHAGVGPGTGGLGASDSGMGGAGIGSGGAFGNGGVTGEGGAVISGKSEAGALEPDAGGGRDGGPSREDGGPHCGIGLSPCAGTCVDFESDNNHCGDCTTTCSAPNLCTNSACKAPCGVGLTECGGACVDTQTDESHCGGCSNTPCAPGNVCEGGTCVIDCGSLTRCGPGLCTDTTTDDVHCGNCTTNCRTTSQVCSGGKCQANCSFPFIACGSTCVNPQSDDQNCNGCGKPCGAGQACQNSVCTKLVENCQNGIDDDRDNLIDCADPDCSPKYLCAAAPAGWTGPVALWTGASGSAPSCVNAGGYPIGTVDAHDGLIPPASACPSCNCAPANAGCAEIQDMWFDKKDDCSSMTPASTYPIGVPPSGACATTTALNPAVANTVAVGYFLSTSEGVPVPPVASGTCSANPSPPNFPDPTWTHDVRACGGAATTGGGCTLGQCLPKPAAPFGASLCVYKSGSGVTSCPPGYPKQQPEYQTWAEGRSCACSCGTVGCGGTLTLYSDTTCTTVQQTVPYDGTCTLIPKDPTPGPNGIDSRSMKWTGAGPVCGQSNGVLSGQPQPSSPLTVCCQ